MHLRVQNNSMCKKTRMYAGGVTKTDDPNVLQGATI